MCRSVYSTVHNDLVDNIGEDSVRPIIACQLIELHLLVGRDRHGEAGNLVLIIVALVRNNQVPVVVLGQDLLVRGVLEGRLHLLLDEAVQSPVADRVLGAHLVEENLLYARAGEVALGEGVHLQSVCGPIHLNTPAEPVGVAAVRAVEGSLRTLGVDSVGAPVGLAHQIALDCSNRLQCMLRCP